MLSLDNLDYDIIVICNASYVYFYVLNIHILRLLVCLRVTTLSLIRIYFSNEYFLYLTEGFSVNWNPWAPSAWGAGDCMSVNK